MDADSGLQMVSLSPLMSNFGALLEGLATVRGMLNSRHGVGFSLTRAAFRVQSSFQDQLITVTDAFQKMDHFYWYVSPRVSRCPYTAYLVSFQNFVFLTNCLISRPILTPTLGVFRPG